MTDRELMQMALDALEEYEDGQKVYFDEEIEALRARLAQPEPEPVATVYDAYDSTGIDWHCKDAPATGTKLYTAPPQREWQGLTDEEIEQTLWKELGIGQDDDEISEFARAIEAKLKEKNS